jgi:hypothetical protein
MDTQTAQGDLISRLLFLKNKGIRLKTDQVKEDEMGGACSTNGGDEECIQDIGRKARRKETIRKTKS